MTRKENETVPRVKSLARKQQYKCAEFHVLPFTSASAGDAGEPDGRCRLDEPRVLGVGANLAVPLPVDDLKDLGRNLRNFDVSEVAPFDAPSDFIDGGFAVCHSQVLRVEADTNATLDTDTLCSGDRGGEAVELAFWEIDIDGREHVVKMKVRGQFDDRINPQERVPSSYTVERVA